MGDYEELKKRIELIEFKQKLLFNNSNSDRFIFESNINEKDYNSIMDLMDKYDRLIENGKSVAYYEFEQEIYDAIPSCKGDYHFCKGIARCFMEESRWPEVYNTLYKDKI